jgi:hypothetical protein
MYILSPVVIESDDLIYDLYIQETSLYVASVLVILSCSRMTTWGGFCFGLGLCTYDSMSSTIYLGVELGHIYDFMSSIIHIGAKVGLPRPSSSTKLYVDPKPHVYVQRSQYPFIL